MEGAPSGVDDELLADLGIRLVGKRVAADE